MPPPSAAIQPRRWSARPPGDRPTPRPRCRIGHARKRFSNGRSTSFASSAFRLSRLPPTLSRRYPPAARPSKRLAGQRVLPATGPPQDRAAASATGGARESPVSPAPQHTDQYHEPPPSALARHHQPGGARQGGRHPPPPHSRPHTTTSVRTPPHTSLPAAARHHTSAPAGCRTVCSHISESTSHTRTSHSKPDHIMVCYDTLRHT